jgi:hypothetical protein
MICPVELAHEMSADQAVRVGDHANHGFLLEDRHGAGHENTGRNFAAREEGRVAKKESMKNIP